MKQYIFIILSCCIVLFSCTETVGPPVYGEPESETEIGSKIIRSGVITMVHGETQATPVEGLKEYHINFLGFDGYLGKIHIYEVDLTTSGLHVAVCNADNSNSTSRFSSQLLSEQVALIDSESNRVYGAVNGAGFASSNSRPYGILVKNGTALRSAFTSSGNNAHTLFFGITTDKKAIMGEAEELGNSIAWTDLQDAIAGKEWLVKNGVVQTQASDSKAAKTAVGTIGKNKVLLFVVDIGSGSNMHFIANGMLSYDISKILIELGVDNAMLVNSGTACTFIGRDANEPVVKNFPSNNGIESKINHGLIIVKR